MSADRSIRQPPTSRRSTRFARTFRRSRACTTVIPSPTSTGRAARRCRAPSSTAMDDYLLPSQRQHALEVSDERRDRRADRGRAPDARGVPERPCRRDRVRPEHDDAHLPPRARARSRVGQGRRDRVTELDHHGNVAPWTAIAEGSRRHRSHGEDAHRRRPARLDRLRGARSRRAPSCSPSAPRRMRSARSPTSRAPRRPRTRSARRSSSTPCTTRRTTSSTSTRSTATSSAARRTSSTGRTSAFSGASATSSSRSTCRGSSRRRRNRRSASRRERRITKAIVGAAAAVDFLASLAGDGAANRRDGAAHDVRRAARARRRTARRALELARGDRRR